MWCEEKIDILLIIDYTINVKRVSGAGRDRYGRMWLTLFFVTLQTLSCGSSFFLYLIDYLFSLFIVNLLNLMLFPYINLCVFSEEISKTSLSNHESTCISTRPAP